MLAHEHLMKRLQGRAHVKEPYCGSLQLRVRRETTHSTSHQHEGPLLDSQLGVVRRRCICYVAQDLAGMPLQQDISLRSRTDALGWSTFLQQLYKQVSCSILSS